MGSKEFIQFAKEQIVKYFNDNADKSDKNVFIAEDDVYVVWYCKSLQNHKALLSTTVADGKYYELAFNGDRQEAYHIVGDCHSLLDFISGRNMAGMLLSGS